MNDTALAFSLVEASITLDHLWQNSGKLEILHHALLHIDKEIDGLDVNTCELIHFAYVKGLVRVNAPNKPPEINHTIWLEDLLKRARRENAARGY
jgi:hypothetical protein